MSGRRVHPVWYVLFMASVTWGMIHAWWNRELLPWLVVQLLIVVSIFGYGFVAELRKHWRNRS